MLNAGIIFIFEKSKKKENMDKNAPCIYNPPRPSGNHPRFRSDAGQGSTCRFHSGIDVDGLARNFKREGWSVFQPFTRLTTFEKVSCV